jgi:predicted transcriptional regulator
MALSPAARAALDQFRSQQHNQNGAATATEDVMDEHSEDAALPSLTNGSGGMRRPPAQNLNDDWKVTSPVNVDRLTGGHNGLFRPEQPKTFKESGISYRVLESLILKTIKQEGQMNESQMAEHLRLSINVFREILMALHKRELLDTPLPMHYDLTNKGRELTSLMEREDAYVGPAPVSFAAYCTMCQQQAKRQRRATMSDVNEVFSNYPMREELKLMLKEGFNSQRVMLFYGPPGNGKSLITDNLHRLLRDSVVLPYAFEFNSKVVQMYDPAYHKLRDDVMKKEEEERAGNLSTSDKPDRRWLISAPPLVTVGTEFKVSHFEIAFDGQYSAPPHVKANNGIFIFDDLGRQTEDHNMILNQFIYPLEQRESIVKFSGGSSMRAPFLERLFLSTNLNHEELLDDAFKRRLLYQILVDRPTTALWKDILKREAIRNGCSEKLAVELGDTLVKWYKEDDRVIRACDPRNIFTMIDAALDDGQSAGDVLDIQMFRRVYEKYPAAYKHEAKFYVGATDSIEGGEEE